MNTIFLKSDVVGCNTEESIKLGRICEIYQYHCKSNPPQESLPLVEEPKLKVNSSSSETVCAPPQTGIELIGHKEINDQSLTKLPIIDYIETELQIFWDDEKRQCTGKYCTPRYKYLDPTKLQLKVVDRRFKIGQKVGRGELHGTVIGIEKLVTLRIIGSEQIPMVIPDVRIESLRPITELFYGVMIEYEGWIGQITSVNRKALWSYQTDGPKFFTTHTDPPTWITSSYVDTDDHIGLGYPYLPRSTDPYPGRQYKFGPTELRKKATWTGGWANIMKEEEAMRLWIKKSATAINVQVSFVQVSWVGRLPKHLSSRKMMPSPDIEFNDLHKIRPLYISPSTYLEKGGAAIYTGTKGDKILPEFQWRKDFVADIQPNSVSGVNQDDTTCSFEGPCEDAPVGQIFCVYKLFSRHSYTVQWKNDETSQPKTFFGGELFPLDLEQQCLVSVRPSYFFCKRVTIGSGFAADEYGVIMENVSDQEENVLVQWVKIFGDGNVKKIESLPEKCSFFDIKCHPIFGELSEARIVVKSRMGLDLGFAYGFTIGTVLSIDRQDLGRLNVFCTSERKVKRMWPHELEIFQEMSSGDRLKWIKKLNRRNF